MSSESYMFYRLVRISTFDEESDSFHPDPSLYGKLRHIDVTVAWPKRGHGTEKCTGLGRVNCNYITIPVVKFIEST
jgi:hypothetical protein